MESRICQRMEGAAMKILSLFDGMSCGRVALERANIPVKQYFASEIDKYAMTISNKNYPGIIQLGDVSTVRQMAQHGLFGKIDLLIGGSPCQGFSFAGKQLAFDDPRSVLFFEFVWTLQALRLINPNIKFLLENVRMKKEHLDVISQVLSVQPICINSSLLSAQNRVRYYWANWAVEQPADKGLLLRDIIESGEVDRDKSLSLTASYYKTGGQCDIKRYLEKNINQMVKELPKYTGGAIRGRYIDGKSGSTIQRLEINGIEKANALTRVEKDSVCVQIGEAKEILGYRANKAVYSINGKSPCLTAMTGGNQEKKISVDNLNWRKLTPIECERLQTLPDNYTAGVSNSQRYKMLGNGWTVDVIAHILKGMPQ